LPEPRSIVEGSKPARQSLPAVGKTVRDTETGFVMMRSSNKQLAAAADAGPAAALGGAPVEGVSAEQQAEAIEQAVETRMEELQQLVASMTGAAAAKDMKS
jgi:hypothetical protein